MVLKIMKKCDECCQHLLLYKALKWGGTVEYSIVCSLLWITMANNFVTLNQLYFACRFCNHGFNNPQAFIAHIEFHVIQMQNHINSHNLRVCMQNNFPRPMSMYGNRVFQGTQQYQTLLLSQPRIVNNYSCNVQVVVPQQPHVPSPPHRNDVTHVTSLPPPPTPQEVSPIDGTKPYIDMLDKPIENNVIDHSDINDHTLDLKLGL